MGAVATGAAERRRRTADEGRQALIDAGRDLLHRRPGAPALDHVRLTDVARHAGVSVGALYHYWDSQDDYREDLLDEVLSPAGFDPPPAAPPGTALDEQVRVGTAAELERLRRSGDLRVLLGLWAADDPELDRRVAGHFRAVGAQWAAFYEAAFAAHGLELRPPFTSEQLAALLAAIGDGLAVRASADPDAVPTDVVAGDDGRDDSRDDAGDRWSLLGAALVALLPAFSRPVGSDVTFADYLAGLRAWLAEVADGDAAARSAPRP